MWEKINFPIIAGTWTMQILGSWPNSAVTEVASVIDVLFKQEKSYRFFSWSLNKKPPKVCHFIW